MTILSNQIICFNNNNIVQSNQITCFNNNNIVQSNQIKSHVLTIIVHRYNKKKTRN
jgi:hypothetical protein